MTGNLIAHNYGAIAIGNDAIHNIVFGNNITDNNYGISIGEAFDNTIQHNNFVNNSLHVDVGENSNDIFWDNGEEGNYWDNYSGLDSDEDGIGDTPYVINEDNHDNYPLTTPVDLIIIPEFPSWIILPLFLTAALTAIIYRRKLTKK